MRAPRRGGEVRPADFEPTRPRSHPTQFTELNELLDQFVRQVGSILGDNFVGAYLQGSFALGDADLSSDCEFIVVVAGPLAPAQE